MTLQNSATVIGGSCLQKHVWQSGVLHLNLNENITNVEFSDLMATQEYEKKKKYEDEESVWVKDQLS